MSELTSSTPPLIEVLTIAGCPSATAAIAVVRRSLADAGIAAPVVVHEIATCEETVAQRFLSSPTVRVDGVDVEPDETWVSEALLREALALA